MTSRQNELLSARPPDNAVSIQLHPLVLLTISDYITRSTLQQRIEPLFGAIIGQYSGRAYTLEHAYECTTTTEAGNVVFKPDFFTSRLEQYKAVHKAHELDLVAIFMVAPNAGPQQTQVQALLQAQKLSGIDGVLLMLFHPEMVDELEGGKLPISVYEIFEEQESVQFWERAFEVETGEAEMIGINHVAKGSGAAHSATAAATTTTTTTTIQAQNGSPSDKKGKGKAKAKGDAEPEFDTSVLSPQDDELLSALTAKANAIKMLKRRLDLLTAYLSSLPQSMLTDSSMANLPADTNFSLLRNIQAMIGRLSLLTPESNSSTVSPVAEAAAKERDDVQITSLLASLTRSIAEAQALGLKYSDVQHERATKERGGIRMGAMMGGDGKMDSGMVS